MNATSPPPSALLFELWYRVPHRATRDVDLLGLGSPAHATIEGTFREIVAIPCEDGIEFLSDSIRLHEIREEFRYDGVHVVLDALLDAARIPVQIDIGFGDAITPAAEESDYPVILSEFPPPHLRTYPRYTAVAEKFEALTALALANSRMKDFFDLYFMVERSEFDGVLLVKVIRATFTRRGSALPLELPTGLSEAFVQDRQKRTQWNAFLRKNRMENLYLADVVELLARFFEPICVSLKTDQPLKTSWIPGRFWQPTRN